MMSTSYCSWPSSRAVPPASSACVVLPSQAPVPSPDPLGSPACFSNPLIMLLAALPQSLLPATGNGSTRQPETYISNAEANKCGGLVIAQTLLGILAGTPAAHYH